MSLLDDTAVSGGENVSRVHFGFSRLEIQKAEAEMPSLMALREEFRSSQPFKGDRVTVSLPMTIQTVILIDTLTTLGAEVQWCSSSNIFSTQDHAAVAVSASKGMTLQVQDEYWLCTEKALHWSGSNCGPDFVIDYGGDITRLISVGVKAEEMFETTGELPDPSSTDDVESQVVQTILRDSLKTDPKKYTTMREKLVRFLNEPSTAITAARCVTTKFAEDLYGFGQSFRPDVMTMTGKVAIVCSSGDVAMGFAAAALKQAGARVIIYTLDPPLNGTHEVVTTTLEDDVISIGDIFVTASGGNNVITLHHMRKMKYNAVICNMSSSSDNEIDMIGLENFPGVQRLTIIKPQFHKWVFPDTNSAVVVVGEGRLMNLGVFMPHSFINQLIAPEKFWKEKGLQEIIVGMMRTTTSGATELMNIYRASERMEARAVANLVDMSHGIYGTEIWEVAKDLKSEIGWLRAALNEISEEELNKFGTVDTLATMILDLFD